VKKPQPELYYGGVRVEQVVGSEGQALYHQGSVLRIPTLRGQPDIPTPTLAILENVIIQNGQSLTRNYSFMHASDTSLPFFILFYFSDETDPA
jgi:hypothetical protein